MFEYTQLRQGCGEFIVKDFVVAFYLLKYLVRPYSVAQHYLWLPDGVIDQLLVVRYFVCHLNQLCLWTAPSCMMDLLPFPFHFVERFIV